MLVSVAVVRSGNLAEGSLLWMAMGHGCMGYEVVFCFVFYLLLEAVVSCFQRIIKRIG